MQFSNWPTFASAATAAAALATLDVIARDNLVDRSARLGRTWVKRLSDLATAHPIIREVRGIGLYFGVELSNPQLADAIMYESLTRGLSFKVGGGTVLTLCPPLTVSEHELEQAVNILDSSLRAVSRRG